MNLIPYVTVWAVFAVVVLAMGGYRAFVALHDDESLDVMEKSPRVIAEQKLAASRIGAIDRWGKSLTVFTVAYGLVIAIVYLAHVWEESAKIHIR